MNWGLLFVACCALSLWFLFLLYWLIYTFVISIITLIKNYKNPLNIHRRNAKQNNLPISLLKSKTRTEENYINEVNEYFYNTKADENKIISFEERKNKLKNIDKK